MSCTKPRESYMKNLEKSRPDSAAGEDMMEEKEEDLDGEIMTAHLTIVILLMIITK